MSDWGILQTFITHPSYITVGIQSSSWPHAEDKIRPLIRTVCCKGWTTWIFSSWGKSHTRQNIVFFPPSSAVCASHPPPTGRLCARPVGGGPVRRLLCLPLPFVLRWPAAGRFGRATRSFSSLIGNFHRPVSLEDVNPLSLSLYIFIISRSVHFMNWSCQVWIWNAQSWSCTPLLIIKYNGLKCR